MDYLDLWLIRHGESTHNFEGRIQGQLDTKLTDLGVRQAEALAKRLEGESFDEVYSSDLERAHHTAKIALPDADIKLDKRLQEISFGILEGKKREEFSEADKEVYAYFNGDRFNRRIPEGETWQDHIKRTESWLNDLPSSGRVIAFSHGGSIRALVFSILGHHPANYEWHIVFGNTCINRFRFEKRTKLIYGVNDTAHLEAQLEGATRG